MSEPRPDVFDNGRAEVAIALATFLPPVAGIVLVLAVILQVVMRLGRFLVHRLDIAFASNDAPGE